MTIKKLFAYSHTAVLNKPIQELYERSWGKKDETAFYNASLRDEIFDGIERRLHCVVEGS